MKKVILSSVFVVLSFITTHAMMSKSYILVNDTPFTLLLEFGGQQLQIGTRQSTRYWWSDTFEVLDALKTSEKIVLYFYEIDSRSYFGLNKSRKVRIGSINPKLFNLPGQYCILAENPNYFGLSAPTKQDNGTIRNEFFQIKNDT
jgi:hypothetical protein